MTYGWAILIIAVVLAVLFSLGIFGGTNLLGTSCLGSPGYTCQNPLMTAGNYMGVGSAAVVSFTLGQSTGSTEYNIGIACAATTTSSGQPNTAFATNAFTYPNINTGVATTFYSNANTMTLVTGETATVSNILCYSSTGAAVPNSLGTTFSGSLFINYTTLTGNAMSTNPWQTTKLGTLTIKVT